MYAKKEPRIHAFVPDQARFKRLRREALEFKHRYPKREARPPLYGLLLGVKDIFHVDGFPTQAGSRLPTHQLTGNEAKSVSLLKAAGMLIAGKTVTTEFAYFAPGPTRNPHHQEHTPGGSSSGSAAAVAAGLVDLALGTQTIGSIIRPASYCGVVGFKPSYGRISTEGVIPLSPSLDHVGLFAQDVDMVWRGAAQLFPDWNPSKTLEGKPFLAIPTGDYLQQAGHKMRAHFEKVVELLGQTGYSVKRLDPMPKFTEIVDRHNTILAAQASQTHAAWYESYRHLYHEKTVELIEKGLSISHEVVKQALEETRRFSLNLSTIMDIHGIDLWISPSATGAALRGLNSTGDPTMNLPWTQAGFPTLGLPSGTNAEGLPLGLQLAADYNRDEALLAWGADIEKILKALQ
jgi:Asp-tRNA(Asn)/Glu-tRNA(Gln) amidotransferase A subunit family amidase